MTERNLRSWIAKSWTHRLIVYIALVLSLSLLTQIVALAVR